MYVEGTIRTRHFPEPSVWHAGVVGGDEESVVEVQLGLGGVG